MLKRFPIWDSDFNSIKHASAQATDAYMVSALPGRDEVSWWDSTLLFVIACTLIAIYVKLGGKLNEQQDTFDVFNAFLVEHLTLDPDSNQYLEVYQAAGNLRGTIEVKHYDPSLHDWIGTALYIKAKKGSSDTVAQKTFEVYEDYAVALQRYEEQKKFHDDFGATECLAEQFWLKAVHVPASSVTPKMMTKYAFWGRPLKATGVYLNRELVKRETSGP